MKALLEAVERRGGEGGNRGGEEGLGEGDDAESNVVEGRGCLEEEPPSTLGSVGVVSSSNSAVSVLMGSGLLGEGVPTFEIGLSWMSSEVLRLGSETGGVALIGAIVGEDMGDAVGVTLRVTLDGVIKETFASFKELRSLDLSISFLFEIGPLCGVAAVGVGGWFEVADAKLVLASWKSSSESMA